MTALGLGYSSLRHNEEWVFGSEESTLALNPPEKQTEQFIGRLLAYIPADVVAGYTLAVALIPSGANWPWIIVGIFCALAPCAIYVGARTRAKNLNVQLERSNMPWYQLCVAPLAFITWVIALPGSPFDSLWPGGGLKALVLGVGTVVIPWLGPGSANTN